MEENVSNEQKIGMHMGNLQALSGERQALIEMIANVDKLLQMHLSELRNLGVDVDSLVQQSQQQQGGQQPPSTQQPQPAQAQEPPEDVPEYYEPEERLP